MDKRSNIINLPGTATMSPLYRGPRRAFLEQKDEPSPVNWRRGFFRIWLLLSAAWIMGWALYLIMFAIQPGLKTTGDFLVIPVVLLGPPVALLLFGIATGWAFRGFKVEEKSSAS